MKTEGMTGTGNTLDREKDLLKHTSQHPKSPNKSIVIGEIKKQNACTDWLGIWSWRCVIGIEKGTTISLRKGL